MTPPNVCPKRSNLKNRHPSKKMLNKLFYDTVLSQAFSPCGNYLITGDIYGRISVFNLSKLVKPEANLTKQDQLPCKTFTVQEDTQINSLLSSDNYLFVGGFGDISGYQWKSVKTGKDAKPAWKVELPNARDSFDKADVNCMLIKKSLLYAGCGDNNIYVFNIEYGKLVRTLSGHTNYVHCICDLGEEFLSGGEDGIVNTWDLREKQVVNKIEPHLNEKIARPDLGKWIGAVSLCDDWLLCGGGPRLSLWHFRCVNNSTVYPLEDKGIHVAQFSKEGDVLAAGKTKTFYKMSVNGDIIAEIPTSHITTYSAIYQEEPFRSLCIAGSSPKIDICSNFNYRDQILSLY